MAPPQDVELAAPPPEPPPEKWDHSDAAYLHELVECVVGSLCPDELDSHAALGTTTSEFIEQALKEARAKVGADVVYDQALIDSLELEDFKLEHYVENDQALRDGRSLDQILEERIAPHRCKAGSQCELERRFQGLRAASGAVDVLCHGARDMMVSEFTPNGGAECSFGPSYLEKREICNDALLKLVKEGRAIAFSLDALLGTPFIYDLHCSPLIWAPKQDKPKGRICLHLSKRSKNYESVNYSLNRELAGVAYPLDPLPLLGDIAELACGQRDENPGVQLGGGTIDIKDGYHQFAQTAQSAKRVVTKLRVPKPEGATGWMILIVIYLVGIFGHAIAGNIFCTANMMINELHNKGRSVPRSKTYIDDTIIIGPSNAIKEWVQEGVEAAEAVWGTEGTIQRDKVKYWDTKLEAIGWEFDFVKWTVQPKERGLAKLLIMLFETIPMGSEWVKERDMEKLQGLVQWYAAGIPAGAAFISSLYACPRTRNERGKNRMKLTRAAKRDMMWWRALILVVYRKKHILGASIDSVRRLKVPQWFMTTDAATTIGGGATLSATRGGELEDMPGDAIRWTREEMSSFERMGVSINTLEYYAVVYYVMLWAEKLRDSVVFVECDNTSAVAWLMKSRAAGGNLAADALAKIFSLFCLTYRIYITSKHIPGIDNVAADFRSRDLVYLSQEADEGICHGARSETNSRRAVCRSLLSECVNTPERIDGQRIHEVLTRLRTVHG